MVKVKVKVKIKVEFKVELKVELKVEVGTECWMDFSGSLNLSKLLIFRGDSAVYAAGYGRVW